MSRKLKILFASLLCLSTLTYSGSVFAQEITPDSGDYDFGATSEYSVSTTLGQAEAAADDNALADTGYSGYYRLIICGLLLSGAAAISVVRKQKHLAK